MKITGIYKITNPLGKVYVGQSSDILKRFQYYKSLHCKSQRKLYYSLLKYGIDKHSFDIIVELPIDVSIEVINNYELVYWECYKDCKVELLNIQQPGNKVVMAQETKELIRLTKIGNKNPMFGKKMSKENIQRLKDNWSGLKNPSLKKDMKGMNNPSFGKKRTEEYKRKSSKLKAKAIIQYDLENNFIKSWDSAKIAGKTLNISQGNISSVCLNLRKKAGGFKWQFKN